MWSEFNSKRWSNSEKPVSGTSSFFYGERSSIEPNILLFAYLVIRLTQKPRYKDSTRSNTKAQRKKLSTSKVFTSKDKLKYLVMY